MPNAPVSCAAMKFKLRPNSQPIEPWQGSTGWVFGRGLNFIAAHETGAFGIMQKQNCLCVDNFASADHGQRFIERWFQDFNILAFA